MVRSAVIIDFFLVMLTSASQNRRAVLVGTVQTSFGTAIPHAVAELRTGITDERIGEAWTDNSGEFRFLAVPPGDYTLKLEASGFQSLVVRSMEVSDQEQIVLPPIKLSVALVADCGGHPVLGSLRVLPGSGNLAILRGSVRLQRGRKAGEAPLLGAAAVTLICAGGLPCGATKTDSRGNFVFSGATAGTYIVRVSHAGFYPIDEPGFEVQGGYEALYHSIGIERCPRLDCDPRRRPRKPPARCE